MNIAPRTVFYGFFALVFLLSGCAEKRNLTQVSISGTQWFINGKITNPGSAAEGLLMNSRMVNATFEDQNRQDFDAEANTDEFIAAIPAYVASGVNAFTLNLQGGMPGYEGAVNSAFNPDGSLRRDYMARVERVIRACDNNGAVVILGFYYQRQIGVMKDEAAIRAGVVNAVRWLTEKEFTNVVVEIANEYPHGGFKGTIIQDHTGMADLLRLAKQTAPNLLISTAGLGTGRMDSGVADACDFILTHWNNTPVEDIPARLKILKQYGKPVVCNEDHKYHEEAVAALMATVGSGAGYGIMLDDINQDYPFTFGGAADDPVYYEALKQLTSRLAH
jgi:hypothetical protein